MISWRHIFFAGLVVVSTLVCVESANAAMLLPELETISSSDSLVRPISCRASLPEDPADGPLSPVEIDRSLVALPLAPLTSTGASVVVSAAPSAAALPGTVVRVDGPLLVESLAREGRVRLPVPFLSGVFRPPRAIG